MAVPSNTYQTYQTKGIREDLSDTIYNIAPTETPFVSMIGRGKAKNTYHEWQTDSLDAANANNAVVEGDDASADAATPTVRIGNYTQLMDKVVQVSTTNQAVNKAGRKNELSYQIAKRGKELKRDIEAMALSKNASVAGDGSTARKSAGVGAWIATNVDHAGDGGEGGFASGIVAAPTEGTERALTETMFKNVIETAWNAGGDPTKVIVGSAQKKAISGFSGIATQYRDNKGTGQAKIVGAADLYISDFGEHQVIADRFAPDDVCYIVDPEYWSLAELQPMKTKELAKTGHSDRHLLYCELTLVSKQEAASAAILDLS